MTNGQGVYTDNVDTLDTGMIHVPGGMEQDDLRFHHANQNRSQMKSYDLLLESSISYFLTMADCG